MNAQRGSGSLLGAALFVAAGTASGAGWFSSPFSTTSFKILLAVSATALLAIRCCGGRLRRSSTGSVVATISLFSAIFAVAALNASSAAAKRMETVELFREALDSREAAFCGRVVSPPTVVQLKHGGARMSFELLPREIVFEQGIVPVPGQAVRVKVEWYGPESMASRRPPFPLPKEGEGWFVHGRLREISSHSPVPKIALALRGGRGSAKRTPRLDAGSAAAALVDIRMAASRALGRGLASDDTGLAMIRAMVLGERTDVPDEVSDAFKASGTIHVFAISGLHVAIVAGAIAFVLGLAPVGQAVKFATLCASLTFYVALTGGRPSAIRALAMSLLAFGAPLAGRQRNSILALSGALVAILAFDPMQIFEIGFVFSFLCTASILVLATPFMEIARRTALATHPGRKLKHAFDTGRPLRRFALKKAYGILSILPVSLAAWLSSAPLTAAVFGRVSPVSIIANVAILPLATASVVTALAALAETAVLPTAACSALPLNRIAAWIASKMATAASISSAIPSGSFESAPWPPVAVATWFTALLALCAWLRRREI